MELKQNKRLPRTRAKAKTMATANRVELCRLDCSCLSNANYKIKYARTRARIHPRAMHRQLERQCEQAIFLATVFKCVGNGIRVATVTSKTPNVLSFIKIYIDICT